MIPIVTKFIKNDIPIDKAKGYLVIKHIKVPPSPSKKELKKMSYINAEDNIKDEDK